MRKTLLIITLCLLSIFAFISCSGEVQGNINTNTNSDATGEENLVVITNLNDDGSAKSIGSFTSAPDIKGVLLKYHHEGTYSINSVFYGKMNNKNAFYLEYLGTEPESTWYGMEFNYVLYVPDKIQKAYEDGKGKNPNSGNPFWWYMLTYYGKDIDNVRNNWVSTLELLLGKKSNLQNPKAKDVNGTWLKSWENTMNVSNGTTMFGANIGIFDHGTIGNQKDYGISPKIIIYDENGRYIAEQKTGDTTTKQIFIPSELNAIYFAGSGVYSQLQALLWYFEIYYKKDNETVCIAYKEGKFGDLLAECMNEYGYLKPDAEKVPSVATTHDVKCDDVDTSYNLGNTYIYDADILRVNGESVQDKNRIYYQVDGDRIYLFFPKDYVDYLKGQMKTKLSPEEYNEYLESFEYNGDFVWDYVKYFCTDEEKEGTSSKLTSTVINKMLDIRVN